MNKCKSWGMALFLFSYVVLVNGLAFADHDCTHQVSTSGGTKDITVDCSSSKTITSDSFWNTYVFNTMVNDMMDRIHAGMQSIQDRLADIFTAQLRSKQVAADMQAKEQDAIDDQQSKQQEQELQLESAKERQEMQAQHQQDMMQAMRDKE